MARTTEITNSDDIIDSRDVIARIDELEGMDERDDDEDAELAALKALAEEGEASPDWTYGETLIRESYFQEYAQQLAEDIGAIDPKATWPMNCIDWEQAAKELRYDYTTIDFDGVEYLIRS